MDLATTPVVILAGGKATRLGEITAAVPKALVPVAGRPFIEHQLERLYVQGIYEVVLCVGHFANQIRDHLGDGARFGVRVRYSDDGPSLRGTGGAVRNALPLVGEACWILYGDSLLDVDYAATLAALPADALGLMTVFRNENRYDTSNVVFRDGRLLRYSKTETTQDMTHIDYGLSLLRREAVERIPAGRPSDLAALYSALAAEGKLAGFEVTRRFYEIGSPAGLREAEEVLRRDPGPPLAASRAGAESRMSFTGQFLAEVREILARLDVAAIEKVVEALARVRDRGGRLFILGVGGSAANAAHAVNDFRKIAGIEAYSPTDNVSELTARTNDEGWETVFAEWLRGSRLAERDGVLVFSVGGGDLERNVSPNLVRAVQHAKTVGATVCGIVGRDGGYTARVADACVVVPTVNPAHVTPHAEAFQTVVWHLFVTHPALKVAATKWESTAAEHSKNAA
jgi:D-sedoheptulose 7-phosphate isomerase